MAELDAAHAQFENEQPRRRSLDNAANQVLERYFAHFAAREWNAMAETLAGDFMTDDRRQVVNAGIRHGRDAEIANMRAFAERWHPGHNVDRRGDPRGAHRPRS